MPPGDVLFSPMFFLLMLMELALVTDRSPSTSQSVRPSIPSLQSFGRSARAPSPSSRHLPKKVTLAVRLEGFGWSQDLALPLPPPPPPSRSPSSVSALDDAEEGEGAEVERRRSGSGIHKHPGKMTAAMRRSSSVSLPSDVDIDAEIAAAVGGAPVGTIMAAPSKASIAAPAWTTLQRQLWIKQREGRRNGDAPSVSVVVEVGLRDARQGAGEGLLRVCAEVAFSACGGRRKVG